MVRPCVRVFTFFSIAAMIFYLIMHNVLLSGARIKFLKPIGEDMRHIYLENYNAPIPKDQTHDSTTKHIVILTYHRSGSTFLGQMFNQNPAAFYVFEPLEGFYNALYGTKIGTCDNLNIWNSQNGSLRNISEFEDMAVAQAVKDILSCQFNHLPMEIFINKMVMDLTFLQTKLKDFKKCMTKEHFKKFLTCNMRLSANCGMFVGGDENAAKLCHAFLHLEPKGVDIAKLFPEKTLFLMRPHLEKYKKCVKPVKEQFHSCLPALETMCKKTDIRAIKTIRMSMTAAEKLLEIFPSVKIVHLMRDPRGMYSSIKKLNRNKGLMTRNLTEMQVLCRNMKEHVLKRSSIISKFPAAMKVAFLENIATDPREYGRKIYSWLGLNFPPVISKWLTANTNATNPQGWTKRSSSYTINKWQDGLSHREGTQVYKVCRPLYKLERSPWTTY